MTGRFLADHECDFIVDCVEQDCTSTIRINSSSGNGFPLAVLTLGMDATLFDVDRVEPGEIGGPYVAVYVNGGTRAYAKALQS